MPSAPVFLPRVPLALQRGLLLLALAVSVALLWRLTPQFASPVGTMAAIAPAAGLVLAAAAVWGWIAWPALLLGAWAGAGFGWQPQAAVAVACTGVHAAVGVWLLHARHRQQRLSLESTREVLTDLLRPALIAGAAGALPAAIMAALAGATAGGMTLALLLHATAAVGGIVLCAPLAWALFAGPRAHWRTRRVPVGVPLALALLTLTAAFVTLARWDLQHAHEAFDEDARERLGAAHQHLHRVLDGVNALHGGLLLTQARISDEQFQVLALPWMSAAGVVELGWLERTNSGQLVWRHRATAAQAVERGREAPDADLLSRPELQSTLMRALAGGPERATPAHADDANALHVTLVRSLRLLDGSMGGLVAATIDPARLLNVDTAPAPDGLDLCVIDLESGARWRRLAGPAGCDADTPSDAMLTLAEGAEFGGRRWLLRAQRPLANAVREGGHWNVWLVAGPAVVGSALLAALLLVITGVAQREARERRHAERAAAINEHELRSIFDTVSAGLVQTAPDGRILNANPAYCRMTGYTLDELRQMNVAQLLAQAAGHDADSTLGDTASGRQTWYRHRSGRSMPVSVSARTVRDADG
ncbi:MAG TPA: PAS domain S-box protein, partial [Burkholderiaceae bacterium]